MQKSGVKNCVQADLLVSAVWVYVHTYTGTFLHMYIYMYVQVDVYVYEQVFYACVCAEGLHCTDDHDGSKKTVWNANSDP